MRLLNLVRQSFRSIFTHKGRSFLTVLGIVIGIGSVIALISLGNGVKASITNQISSLGTTTLTVTPGGGFGGEGRFGNNQGNNTNRGPGRGAVASTLSQADFTALQDTSKVPDVTLTAGSVGGSAVFNDQQPFSVQGTSPSFFDIHKLTVAQGQSLTDQDITASKKVVVLGNDLATTLFGTASPIGKPLTVQQDTYQIIGVLASAPENSFNNLNTNAYVPYTAAMSTFGTDKFSNFTLLATNQDVVSKAKAEVQSVLLADHSLTDLKLADFNVSTPADLLSTVGNVTGILTSLLSGIAAISLLVGGIGIMNIMLVSVTERTREIGLRKAVGAKTRDILVQFLIEAVLLTLTGGVLGIVLGYLMGTVAGRYIGFSPVVTGNAILLAVSISSAVGLVFGLYPAARASRLNPIDALRYE